MDKNKLLKTAKEAAVEAGIAIMEVYLECSDMQVEYKDGNMPLTAADKASNAIIVKRMRQEFPEYAVLSEEEKDDRERLNNPYCFVIDPLDGTKEFIKRNGQFTVNIALSHNHKSIMGIIYVPVTGELYYAFKEEGACLITLDADKIFKDTRGMDEKEIHEYVAALLEKNKEAGKLKVSDRTKDIRVVMSSSHGCEEMDRLLEKYSLTNFVKMGSSLKGCVIAKGDAEVYYRHNPTMEWDTAAMQCIVEESGAIFRQMDDSPMEYNRENSLNHKGFYIINCPENKLE